MSSLLLALDLGTTGVRALAVAADGGILGRAYRPLGTRFPAPGRVEQDPIEMWESSLAVLRTALRESGIHARHVAGIGVATQRATAVAWDSQNGAPLAPAIGWQDQRESQHLIAVRKRGVPITSLPAVNKFAWWLENDAAIRAARKSGRLRLGTPDAWLTANLCGHAAHVTDPGQASCTGIYHLGEGNWSPAIADLFEIPIETLPRVAASSEVVGDTPADLLGAPIPVASRAGDQQAACFAHGIHAAGGVKLTLGTAAMLDLHAGNQPSPDVPGCFPLALWRLQDESDAFLLEASVLTAGAAVDWLVELGIAESALHVDQLARSARDTAGVCFVPSLQGLGTPYMDAGARGFIGGLTRGTHRAHLARATLEGIAQRCVDAIEGLPQVPQTLHVDGGLARSDFLLETLAGLSGNTVVRAGEIETTALGAAQLAGLATKVYRDPADCRRSAPATQSFAPELPASERRNARERWHHTLETRVVSSP